MDNPGIKVLGNADLAAINAATAAAVITSASDSQGATQPYIDRLSGMLAASISANFVWGSGGTSLKVIIETSLNQGATWLEVARIAFGTASAEKVVNLSGLTPKTTAAAPGALSDDACLDGILGDRFRCRILTVGAYAGNTSLAVRMHAR